jgi:cytochrome c-type biogenesis protein CcmH/NrfG
MSQNVPPLPGPEPDKRRNRGSLEDQLRALPPPPVPESLKSKLVGSIPRTAGPIATSTGLSKSWIVIAGICVAGVLVGSFAVYSWMQSRNVKEPAGLNAGASSANSTTTAATSSQVIEKYEQAVLHDPYDADAWFNLAKSQIAAHRSADAISSAHKALDIARSNNRTSLAQTVEAWLKANAIAEPGQPSR